MRKGLITHPWNTISTLWLRLVVQGESTGGWLVKFVSNWETSSSLVNVGSKGGFNLRLMTSAQLMCYKKWPGLEEWRSLYRICQLFFTCDLHISKLTTLKYGCVLIESASVGPAPNLWFTCRFRNFRIRSRASGVRYGGKFSFP